MMKDLEKVSLEEQEEFFRLFDHVLCDMDGVIWLKYEPLPGAAAALDSLKKLGKNVKFVTNNDFATAKDIYEHLEKNNFNGFTSDDIMQPIIAMIEYLKNINFDKEIYLLGTASVRAEFERAGFKLAPLPAQEILETIDEVVRQIADNENIGCVITIMDFNQTFMKLQRCLTYLSRKDCIWIVGPTDKQYPAGAKGPVYGPHFFIQGIKEISGRDYIQLAKPSSNFNDFFVRKLNITNPKRVLLIGDTIDQDMRMASVGGYRKLLVFTGVAKMTDIENWHYDEELKPDYYVQSLESLNRILKNISITNKL